MKYKVIITIVLFIFSFLLIKSGSFLIRENDKLMKTIKEKQDIYNQEPINAIITNNTMIPGISGKKVNLKKSYQKMKGINEFQESLLVFDEIKPSKSINSIYDKVIVSGNQSINKISIVLENNNHYCFTTNLDTTCNDKHTILVHKITSNHLMEIKEKVHNGIIFFFELKDNNELSFIIKYLKNNNYDIVPIEELIKE